jgi:hypothetical protein
MSVAEVVVQGTFVSHDPYGAAEYKAAQCPRESRQTVAAEVSYKGKSGVQRSSLREKMEQQAQKLESLAVEKIKKSFEQIFEVWGQDFNPNAPYGISYVSGWLNSVIQKESQDTIDAFLKDIQAAKSRRKIAKLIEKELKIIANGRPFVDQATAVKLDEAALILTEQLGRLGTIPQKTGHADGAVKVFPKVEGEGTLGQRKRDLYAAMTEWKEELKVTPAYVVSYIPGVTGVLQTKADAIFENFIQQISHAKNASEFRDIVIRIKERMTNFRAFTSYETAAQVDAGVEILGNFIESI